MKIKQWNDIDVAGKRVIVREDLNVPLQDGVITNDNRIQRALPTIRHLQKKDAAVIILSHLGRPRGVDEQYSLAPVAEALSEQLGEPVKFIEDFIRGFSIQPGEIVLCENVRFLPGETENEPQLAKRLAKLGDVFIMDAFATAHRAHASTEGVARRIEQAAAGPLLMAELTAIEKLLDNPEKPVLAIVGGSKVSTKMAVLRNLLPKVDQLIVGGGIANTFLAAKDFPIGDSLFEPDWVEEAANLLREAESSQTEILCPMDVVVAAEMSEDAKPTTKKIMDVTGHDKIFDIGPETCRLYQDRILAAKTILWNGPVGVFELKPFQIGTKALADAIASSEGYSVAGGGDTVAAIEQFNMASQIDYISTGGGAFLEMIEGKTLPGVAVLIPEEE